MADNQQAQSVNYKELADRASTFMDADWVRPVQAQSWVAVLSEYENPVEELLGTDLETARKYADKSQAVPSEVKEIVKNELSDPRHNLKASHQWLKGFIATTIAYTYPDEVGDCKASKDQHRTRLRDRYLKALEKADEEMAEEDAVALQDEVQVEGEGEVQDAEQDAGEQDEETATE